MESAWHLRPAGPDDLPEIVDVIRTESLRFTGRSGIDLARVREQLDADPDFDYGRDQLVAERDGEIIAVAVINPRASNISVHPEHELPGLRGALLAWTERRQLELGRSPFRAGVSPAVPAQVALLASSGYRLERFYSEMVYTFSTGEPLGPPGLSDRYRVRLMDREKDLSELHQLDQRAFADAADFEPVGVDEYNGRYLAIEAFAPNWSLVVESHEHEIVGSLVGHSPPERPIGYVALLAVGPGHRHRGIGRALLLHAFATIAGAGLAAAELDVASDNPHALGLYTSVGMVETDRYEHHTR